MKRVALAVIAVLLVCAVLFKISKSRTFQFFGEIVPRVETNQKVVALTFDDGPAPEVRELLDTLAAKNVKATFFLIGVQIAEDPADAKRIVDDGHQVGNHSWSHARMVLKTPSFYAREIEDTDRQIRKIGYRGEIDFRAPFGKKLIGLPWYLAKHHRREIMWDVEPESFGEIEGHTDRIIANVLKETRPGSIIILHPQYANRAATRAAVGPIIDGLRARGYTFLKVDQLLALRK
jgi:peptidoglycan/xylan/chitin deacetylase (PgdA/CDA1 family)